MHYWYCQLRFHIIYIQFSLLFPLNKMMIETKQGEPAAVSSGQKCRKRKTSHDTTHQHNTANNGMAYYNL